MELNQEQQQSLATRLNSRVWVLLGKAEHTDQEAEEMLLAAYASAYHWSQVGTAAHRQRAYWLIARVYCVLNRPSAAMEYAEVCARITKTHARAMEDFDRAYAIEGLARAHAAQGNLDKALQLKQQAFDMGEEILKKRDRELFVADLARGPWFNL